MTPRSALTCLLAPGALALVAFWPSFAHAQSILDRVRERATSRVESGAESRTNQKVDSAVDETLDCAFDPATCAKKVTEPSPAPTPTPTPTPAPGSAKGAQPAGPADTLAWYAEQNGSRVGPMPRAQLDSMVAGGQVTAQTLVWREGLDGWKAAGELPELAATFAKLPPPLPVPSGPPPLPSGRAR